MKLYSFFRGVLQSGIEMIADQKFGPVIYLGEEGRGRRYEKISLARREPAVLKDGRIYEAHPLRITVGKAENEKSFFVLARPRNPQDPRALVRVCTCACYTRHSHGYWEAVKGNPITIVAAHGAHGDAGRLGTWDDGLVLMTPGDVLKVQPEGGYKTRPYAIIMDLQKGLSICPFADYEMADGARQAYGNGISGLKKS
jgi:hypothetical protein